MKKEGPRNTATRDGAIMIATIEGPNMAGYYPQLEGCTTRRKLGGS